MITSPKIAAVTRCSTGEGKYLAEWAAWLSLLGVGRFYIYEHNNEPDAAFTAAADMLTSLGVAEFHPSTETGLTDNVQMDDMLSAAELCREAGIEWLITIDLDEFPVITRHDNLLHLVESMPPAVNQILLNWRLYGSSGETAFDGTRTHFEKFTHHALETHHTGRIGKGIIRVSALRKINLHLHSVSGITVNGDLEELRPAKHPHGGSRPAYGIGYLAHFSVRSRAEFEEKAQRGYPDEWHGKFPGERYWTNRNLNDVQGPDLSAQSTLIKQRLAAWEIGSDELDPANVPIEAGRLRKVDPAILPKVPQSVALWRIKTVLEIDGKLAAIAALIDSLSMEDPASIAIRNAWNGGVTLERTDPGTLALGEMADLTAEELDDIFTAAERLSTAIG